MEKIKQATWRFRRAIELVLCMRSMSRQCSKVTFMRCGNQFARRHFRKDPRFLTPYNYYYKQFRIVHLTFIVINSFCFFLFKKKKTNIWNIFD